MKINIFLIKTIETLGKHNSLEEDIVDFLLDILKRQILNYKEEYLEESNVSDLKTELKKQDEYLLNLFLKLTILRTQYNETRKNSVLLEKQILKFSSILSNILKIPENDIKGSFKGLSTFNESNRVFNNYYEIQQKLLNT